MEPGPATTRPDESLTKLVPRLRDTHLDRIIITRPVGELELPSGGQRSVQMLNEGMEADHD